MNPSKNWWKSCLALSEFERLKLNLFTVNWHHCLSKKIKTNLFTKKMMSIEIKTLNSSSLKAKTYKNPVPDKIWTKRSIVQWDVWDHLFFSSCDFLEVRTFLRGTLLLFSLDLEEIFRLVAGEEGTGILVSVFDDVDKDCWSCNWDKWREMLLRKYIKIIGFWLRSQQLETYEDNCLWRLWVELRPFK